MKDSDIISTENEKHVKCVDGGKKHFLLFGFWRGKHEENHREKEERGKMVEWNPRPSISDDEFFFNWDIFYGKSGNEMIAVENYLHTYGLCKLMEIFVIVRWIFHLNFFCRRHGKSFIKGNFTELWSEFDVFGLSFVEILNNSQFKSLSHSQFSHFQSITEQFSSKCERVSTTSSTKLNSRAENFLVHIFHNFNCVGATMCWFWLKIKWERKSYPLFSSRTRSL